MGDRTYVELSILVSQAETAEKLIGEYNIPESTWSKDLETTWGFHDVASGTLDFLDELRDAGIAYNSHWSAGDAYGPGTTACRFTSDGTCVMQTIYDDAVNPELGMLMTLLDNPEKLMAFIREHHALVTIPHLTPDQEVFGKLFRARQLIEPNRVIIT